MVVKKKYNNRLQHEIELINLLLWRLILDCKQFCIQEHYFSLQSVTSFTTFNRGQNQVHTDNEQRWACLKHQNVT